MSQKRGMSKQQRLYYEYQNKERVRQELQEYVKQLNDFNKTRILYQTGPEPRSYYQ
jgi:hypothetical protein